MRTFMIRFLSVFVLCLLSLPLAAQEGEGVLNGTPPKGITVDELIQRFASKEKEFKVAREQYTWTQSVKVQTLGGHTVDGEYQQVFDVLFDDKGKRVQLVKFAPQNTLTRIQMTQESRRHREAHALHHDHRRSPFYNVKYLGQQQEDELNCYVFDLGPKKIDKGQRYFDGRIWVDDHDFQIVKTYGKNVPDLGKAKKDSENLFPRFTTWREQIDGKYWFPTYTKVDDNLHFVMGDVHIRQVVRYENYRRFGSKTRIIYQGQEIKRANDGEKKDKQGRAKIIHAAQWPHHVSGIPEKTKVYAAFGNERSAAAWINFFITLAHITFLRTALSFTVRPAANIESKTFILKTRSISRSASVAVGVEKVFLHLG